MSGLRRFAGAIAALCVWLAAPPALAQDNLFAPGWRLVQDASSLKFQSVKNVSVIESSAFASFSGQIDETGLATVEVSLESVDTGIDLRNVRMRFLFFETYKHPVATIRLRIDPAQLADLPAVRRLPMRLTYTLDLHGVIREMTSEVMVTLITDGLVSVSSTTPIPVPAADFGLDEGVRKLEDAAKVTIIPAGSVSFDFIFRRNEAASTAPVAAAPQTTPASPPATQTSRATAALEPERLDRDACAGRFEILSRTGAVYFASGSAQLDGASLPLLTTLLDIVERCPALQIEVGGHTDSIGSDMLNQRLSEARARAVAGWLVGAGVPSERLRSVGYGELRPVAPNDNRRNRALNRRIEFTIVDGG